MKHVNIAKKHKVKTYTNLHKGKIINLNVIQQFTNKL